MLQMYQTEFSRRSWVEIDLNQIKTNLLAYREAIPEWTQIMAVVKADAYGHGDAEVSKFLNRCGIRLFAVSNINEAMTLRKSGVTGEILILGYTPPESADLLLKYDITQALISEEYADTMAKICPEIKCQFALDTGMNRIGMDADFSDRCVETIRAFQKRMNLNGLFTHLCVADSSAPENVAFTRGQIRKFEEIAKKVADLPFPYIHCLNSAGGLSYADSCEYHGIVRLGIILYGLKPDANFQMPAEIRPSLTWKSVVSLVKTVNPGEFVGYGRSFCAKRRRVVATIPTGYADGLSRRLSGSGFVTIQNVRAPIIGKICMDQMMVDATEIPGIAVGDEVEIIGKSYTADDMAEQLDTIGYEVVCGISKRVPRVYRE